MAFVAQLFQQAIAFHRRGQLADAERAYSQVIVTEPNHFGALHYLGVIRAQQGRNEEGAILIGRALKQQPLSVEALSNLGNVLAALERYDEALASYDRALTINSRDAATLNNRGNALCQIKRYADALKSYDLALALTPSDAVALNNRGGALRELERFAEALSSFDAALKLAPGYAQALSNRGKVLKDLGRLDEALASCQRAIDIVPNDADGQNNLGVILHSLRRYEDAIAAYERAIRIAPDHADASTNRAASLLSLNRFEEAVASCDSALKFKPDAADAWQNRAAALYRLGRHTDAIASVRQALVHDSCHRYSLGNLVEWLLGICAWDEAAALRDELKSHVRDRKSVVMPFAALALLDDAEDQLRCAQNYAQAEFPEIPAPAVKAMKRERIRVAYLSADFRRHPVAFLAAQLYELHDRSQFEVIGISFGPDDGSEIRARIVRAFDQFHDVGSLSDHEAAMLLRRLGVDIAIDLMGYTERARPGILASRAAPVQVNYLGYPGTMGASFIDYVIADRVVAPFGDQAFYTEKIVHLPDSYQMNDALRPVAAHLPSRREAGLPEDAFVFCSFNNSWKFNAPLFEIWMRLLRTVERSVLWLYQFNPLAADNLRREAQARDVDPVRLVFAPHRELADHLGRLKLADLFLDSLPYNAHTTASDALWVGVPVVTCTGTTFAGRVAASLLQSIGLPDLVTRNLEDYEALAQKLATDSALLQSIKERLLRNRLSYPLFDSDRSRRHIEAAYRTMWDIRLSGRAPRSFSVEPIGKP